VLPLLVSCCCCCATMRDRLKSHTLTCNKYVCKQWCAQMSGWGVSMQGAASLKCATMCDILKSHTVTYSDTWQSTPAAAPCLTVTTLQLLSPEPSTARVYRSPAAGCYS
jgi:hypothetical protein